MVQLIEGPRAEYDLINVLKVLKHVNLFIELVIY